MKLADKHYADLKWLTIQPQWKTFKEYMDDQVQSQLKGFLQSRMDVAELHEFQMKVQTQSQVIPNLEQAIKDHEFDYKEKNK